MTDKPKDIDDTTYDISKHALSPNDILSPDYLGRKPTILVNIAQDDVTRGDTAGRKGLANVIAKKIDADIIYADEATMAEQYPDQSDVSNIHYEDKLAKHLSKHRVPDIVFGFSCYDALKQNGKDNSQVLYITDINESLSNNAIVSHHLTDDMLKEEGKKFDTAYPKLKQPIIAVFLVHPQLNQQKDFIQNLSKIASKYKEATIFLCGSRRTGGREYDKLLNGLQKSINGSKLFSKNKGITVTGFKFDRKADFNPYRGLIARSEHFILWGDSMSMMSEPLITGKTVHTYDLNPLDHDLEKKGIVVDFNKCARKKEFLTQHFKPINITETIADKITVGFKCTITEKIKEREGKCKIYPTKWQNHLIKIYFDYNHIKEIPKKLRQDNDFILACLRQNGMALTHLSSKERLNNNVIRLACVNNREAFKFAPKRAKNHDETMFQIIREYPVLYPECSDRLKSSHSFHMRLLNGGIQIPHYMNKDLFKHRDIALAAIEMSEDMMKNIPETITDDPVFIQEALNRNIDCFQFLPEKYRGQKGIIQQIINKKPGLIRYATKDILNDEIFVTQAIEKNGGTINFISEELRKSLEITCLALKNGAEVSDIDKKFYSNKTVMLVACRHSFYGYYSCDKNLRSDYDICIATLKNDLYGWRDLPEKMQYDTPLCIGLLKIDMEKGWDIIAADKKQTTDFLIECAKIKDFPIANISTDLYKDLNFTKELIKIRPEWKDNTDIARALDNKNTSTSKIFNNLKSYSKAVSVIKKIKSALTPTANSGK